MQKVIFLTRPTTILVGFLLICLSSFSLAQRNARLEFWTISLAPTFNSLVQETIALYEQANPNVQVVWRDYTLEAIGFELLNAIAAGRAPDVVNLNVPMVLEYHEQGLLLDLHELLESETQPYFDGMLASFEVDGAQLGVPWYVTPPLVIYNRDIFSQAGLDPDVPPRDLAELVSYAQQIRDRTGMYGYIPNISQQNLLYRFLEAGLPVLNADGTVARFNSPAHVAYLEDLIVRQQRDYLPEDTLFRAHAGAVDRFMNERLGMLLVGPQMLPRIKSRNPHLYDSLGLAPFPLGRGEVMHAPLMGLSVPRASRHPAEALHFALFVTSDERLLSFSQQTVIFPTTRTAARDPFFTFASLHASLEEQARQLEVTQLQYAQDLTMNLPNASDLFKRFEYEVELAFSGYKTPQEALDDAVKFWNSRL